MTRPLRIDEPEQTHHVMNRGANHQRTFFCDADRVEFGRLLAEIHDRWGVTTIAYCLMDNHYHLVLYCPDGGLSAALQHLGSVYTQHANDRQDRDGALFRGRFRSIPIETVAYLLFAVRYVHRNCLVLPGVAGVDDYRWSSHRTYLGARTTPSFVDTTRVLGHFAGVTEFDAFVRGESNFDPARSLTSADVQAVIRLAIAEVDDADDGVSRTWLERTVMHLLAGNSPTAATLLSEQLPPPASGARRSAMNRARSRLDMHPEIARMLDIAIELLGTRQCAA